MNNKIFLIIGLPRSGTTYLGKLLSKFNHIEYFDEPNYVWKNGNAYKKDDFLGEEHINKKNYLFITKFFSSKKIIVEKTPANILRLNFIRTVFPKAKYIFLDRNENDTIKSITKKWLNEDDNNSFKIYNQKNHKVRQFFLLIKKFYRIPFIEKPAYWKDILREFNFFILKKKRNYWGPKIKNWEKLSKNMNTDELIKLQYRSLNKYKNEFKNSLKPNEYIEVCYENLVKNTEFEIDKINKFIFFKD